MNIISLFSGCGGLDLGFEKSRIQNPVAKNLTKQFGKHLRQIIQIQILLKVILDKLQKRISVSIYQEKLME